MRAIDSTIKSRLLQAWQTQHNNSNPAMEVRVLRPRTPIFHRRFWQESVVAADTTAICTSVAVRRTSDNADRVFVAYVTSTGDLVVKSAAIMTPVSSMVWTVEETISGCLACSVEFDGHFANLVSKSINYQTDDLPWLFYTTSSGQLMAGILGGNYESLVGANVTAFDSIRGVASKYMDIDQGLLVFYVLNGTVYYREYIGGVWGDQQTVGIAPANIVSIKAERVFDWRIVLQVTDNTGALYEIFTKMEASGWNGTEYIQLSNVSVTKAELIDVYYHDYQAPDELIVINSIAVSLAMLMSIYSPVLLRAWNIPTIMEDSEEPGTYYDDYGYRVVFEFDQFIPNAS